MSITNIEEAIETIDAKYYRILEYAIEQYEWAKEESNLTVGKREFIHAYNTTWVIIDELDGGIRVINYYTQKMKSMISNEIDQLSSHFYKEQNGITCDYLK